jgi:hypothetical protein
LSGADEIRAQALEVAAGWSPPDAPEYWQLTASVFRVIAEHEDLPERLADLPPDRLRWTRPVTWLSLDPLVPLGPSGSASMQGLPLPDALVRYYQQGGVFAVLGARTFNGRCDGGRLLARAHPSGHWIEWIDSPASQSVPFAPDRHLVDMIWT